MCALLSVALLARGCLVRGLLGLALGGATGSACEASGEAEDAARRPKSSSRRFSFLPMGVFSRMNEVMRACAKTELTIVSLRNAVLNAPALCRIGHLGPVLIRVFVETESAAVTMTRGTMHCE